MSTAASDLTTAPEVEQLLSLAAPDHRLCTMELAGRATGLLTDGRGLTAVLELDRPPALGGTVGEDQDATVQPLLTVVPGASAGSAPLAVHSVAALRVDAADDFDLEPARRRLAAALGQVRQELRPTHVTVLDRPTLATVLAEVAHYRPGWSVRTGRSASQLEGPHQACYQLPGWDRTGSAWALLPAVVTLAGTESGALARLATRTPAELARAEAELRAGLRAEVTGAADPIRRLRGRPHRWLGATLPLGRPGASCGLPPPPASGVPLGVDRTGQPALQPLVGSLPTRVLMIAEEAADRRLSAALGAAGVRVGKSPATGAGSPAAPLVRRGRGFPPAPGRWCTDLVVTSPDQPVPVELLAHADVVLTRPLSEPQAAVVSAVLGLGRVGTWLRAGAADLLATVTSTGVKWAQLPRG